MAGVGYGVGGLAEGFLQGYQTFHKAKEDHEYHQIKQRLIDAQIRKLDRGPEPRAIDPDRQAYLQAGTALRLARIKALTTPQPSLGDTIINQMPSNPGPQSAIPAQPNTPAATPTAALDLPASPNAEESASHGGLITAIPALRMPRVKHYAMGGEVEPDTEDDDNDDDMEGGADMGGVGGYSMQAAHEAARDGMIHNISERNIGQSALQTPAVAYNNRAHASGIGALTPADMAKIRAKVAQPGMSEADVNMAALSAVKSFYLRNGDPKGADALAGSMVRYFRGAYDRNRALAQVAAENGDVDTAINYARQAYANVPDGMKLDIKKGEGGNYSYSVIDMKTGKAVGGAQTVPADKMLSLIQQGAQKTFDGLMLDAAGARAGTHAGASDAYKSAMGLVSQGKEPEVEHWSNMSPAESGAVQRAQRHFQAVEKLPKPPSLGARKESREAIDQEMGLTVKNKEGKDEAKWGDFGFDSKYKDLYAGTAAQIHASNDTDPAATMRVMHELTDVGSKKEYSIKPNKDGTADAIMKDGTRVRLSNNAIAQLGTIIAKNQELKETKEAKAKADKELEGKRTSLADKQSKALEQRRKGWQSDADKEEQRVQELRNGPAIPPNSPPTD